MFYLYGAANTLVLLYHLYVETERTEAVITTDHGTHRILHPAIVEVPLTFGQRLYKLPHGAPGRGTHAFGALTIFRDPLLTLPDIASVLNGILILCHEVRIDRLTYGCNSDFIHTAISK